MSTTMLDKTTPTATDLDALLRPDQAAQFIGLTTRFLEARRLRGGGPPFVRISVRAIRYRRRDLLEWTESLVRSSTSDTGAAA
jgi:hypothetical protein